MIRAVLFDLGNTLLDYSLQGRWREFLRQRLAQMHPLVSEVTASPACDVVEFAEQLADIIGGERARAIERSGRSWHFRERLREELAAVGANANEDHIERLTDFFYQPIRACNKPYPDTAPTLDRLRAQEMRLAIITNAPWDTPARLLRGDVEQWNMGDFFDAFVCSGDVAWRKPNPAFMLDAAEALAMAPSECLVVGNSIDADIAGARAAGMRCVWVNRDHQTVPRGAPVPDWQANSLSDVLALLSAL